MTLATTDASMDAPTRRVAVVLDADAFFREFQTYVLGTRGYVVRSPTQPSEFSAPWVRAQAPDVVITDVLLPGKSGLDLTRELRAPPGIACPIIVYTVLRLRERAFEAGADKFLLKPLLHESYLTALDDATKGASGG